MRECCEVNWILQWYLCEFAIVHLNGRKEGGTRAVKIVKVSNNLDDPYQFHPAILRTLGLLPLCPAIVQEYSGEVVQ